MWEYMNMNMTLYHGLFMLFFWILLFFIIKESFFAHKNIEQSTLDILKMRFSKGEISLQQYNEIKNTIYKETRNETGY